MSLRGAFLPHRPHKQIIIGKTHQVCVCSYCETPVKCSRRPVRDFVSFVLCVAIYFWKKSFIFYFRCVLVIIWPISLLFLWCCARSVCVCVWPTINNLHVWAMCCWSFFVFFFFKIKRNRSDSGKYFCGAVYCQSCALANLIVAWRDSSYLCFVLNSFCRIHKWIFSIFFRFVVRVRVCFFFIIVVVDSKLCWQTNVMCGGY